MIFDEDENIDKEIDLNENVQTIGLVLWHINYCRYLMSNPFLHK